MNQAEIDARDFNGEGQEPTNPVVKTEVGSWLKRVEYQQGEIDWYRSGEPVPAWMADFFEDAYTMGVAQ